MTDFITPLQLRDVIEMCVCK